MNKAELKHAIGVMKAALDGKPILCKARLEPNRMLEDCNFNEEFDFNWSDFFYTVKPDSNTDTTV